jgi:uncharacterized membrane protein
MKALHLLLSHHEPPFMHRCWRFSIRGRSLYICARCSALLIGILLALIIQFNIFYIVLTPLTFLGAFVLSLPAVFDWSTQTLGLRESRNPFRALTGLLLGYAVGFVFSSFNIFYMLLVAVLYSGYTLGFGAIAPRLTSYLHRRKSQDNTELPRLLPPHPNSEKPNRDEE